MPKTPTALSPPRAETGAGACEGELPPGRPERRPKMGAALTECARGAAKRTSLMKRIVAEFFVRRGRYVR